MKRRGKRERKREEERENQKKKWGEAKHLGEERERKREKKIFCYYVKKYYTPRITDDHTTSSFLAFLFLRFALRRRWGRRFEIVKYFHPVDVISIR